MIVDCELMIETSRLMPIARRPKQKNSSRFLEKSFLSTTNSNKITQGGLKKA